MPRAFPVALFLAGGLLFGCAEEHTPMSPSEPTAAQRLARVKIDGAISNNEWRDAASLDFKVNAPEGLVPARLLAQRDDSHLYLAVVVQRSAGNANTEADFEFDSDNDDVPFEEFDDAFGTGGFPGSGGCFDGYRAIVGSGSFDEADDLDGGTNDCVGALGSTATTTTYEMRQPLNGGDIHDIAVGKALRQVGFELDVRIPLPGLEIITGSGDEARTQVASFGKYCKITVFPAVSLGPCPSGQVASVRVTRNQSTTQIGIITMNPHQADVVPPGPVHVRLPRQPGERDLHVELDRPRHRQCGCGWGLVHRRRDRLGRDRRGLHDGRVIDQYQRAGAGGCDEPDLIRLGEVVPQQKRPGASLPSASLSIQWPTTSSRASSCP